MGGVGVGHLYKGFEMPLSVQSCTDSGAVWKSNSGKMMQSCQRIQCPIMIRVAFGLVSLIVCVSANSNMQDVACQMRLVQVKVRKSNCIPVTFVAPACSGACASYTSTSATEPWTLETHCTCCQYGGGRVRRFAMRCLDPTDGRRVTIEIAKVKLPTSCMCRPCSDMPNRINSAENNILTSSPLFGTPDVEETNAYKRTFDPFSTYIYDPDEV